MPQFDLIKQKPEYAFITDWTRMRPTLKRTQQNQTATFYNESFPDAGSEMDLLIAQRGKAFAKEFTFAGATVAGTTTTFAYSAKDPKKPSTFITAETPPTDARGRGARTRADA